MAVHMNRPRARLRPGDLAEIRAADEILQTLDVDGTLDYLPFMPERVEFCGRRFRTPRPLSEFRRAGRWRIVPRVEFPGHREAHATHHLHAGDDRLERRPPPALVASPTARPAVTATDPRGTTAASRRSPKPVPQGR